MLFLYVEFYIINYKITRIEFKRKDERMNKLGGITVSFKHHCFEQDNEYVVLVDNFKEDESHIYLYLDKIVAINEGDGLISMQKTSEFALIASYDKQTKMLTGKEILESFSSSNHIAGKKPKICGFEQYEVEYSSELADFLRRYIYEQNKYLFRIFSEIIDRDDQWHGFLMYLDDLDNIEKLCSTMNPRDILSQLYGKKISFDSNGKKLKNIVGLPVDIMEQLNQLDMGNALHYLQDCVKNQTATVDEVRLLLNFIAGYNVLAAKKKNDLDYIGSNSFIGYICEAHKYGMSLKELVACVSRELLLYQGLEVCSPSRIAMHIRDIGKMLTDMNQEIIVQQNVAKWHFITSRNYQLFKKSRADEYTAAAAKLNERFAAKIGNYIIQCPETEQELLTIGNKYNNCLPTYRDRVIDDNAKIFSLYQTDDAGNVVDAIPTVTFEVNDNLDFVQIKTFFDADVTDPAVLFVIKEWRKKVGSTKC